MIGTHSKHDNMVLLFGKVLRNEIEESFFYDQMKNSTQIATSLKRYLMEKHPLKPNADIKKLHKEIMEGLISRQQANDLINVIFFGKDAKAVELLCDHLFAESLHE